jgi:vacuolar-type H+-ATPase subunit E/Vma4
VTYENEPRITKADLETKFQELQDDLQGRASDKKQSIIAAASIASAVVVLIAYLLGRRGGRKRRSVVEIRR